MIDTDIEEIVQEGIDLVYGEYPINTVDDIVSFEQQYNSLSLKLPYPWNDEWIDFKECNLSILTKSPFSSRCRSSTENPSTAIHWTSFDLENNMTWSNNRSFKSKPLNNIQQAQFSIGWRFCPVCGHKLYQKNESCSGSISIKCLKCGNIATVDLAYRRR